MTGLATRRWERWLWALTLMMLTASAQAAERVALVIGNAAYKNTIALPNAHNDAEDMARLLDDELGFEVLLHLDAGRDAMETAVYEFGRKAESAELALVFYAGHGMEFEGRNYLLPVDAPPLTHESQVRRLIRLDDVVTEAAYAHKVGIVLVDACRDNPLANNLRASLPANRSAAVSRGLGKLDEPPSQTLVVYATEAGNTASDGGGRNSPFTQGLLAHLATERLEVSLLFRKVRDEVMRISKNRQRPFVYGSLGGEPIYLAMGGEAHDGVPPLRLPPVGDDPAREAWAIIKVMSDGEAKRQALIGFIERYPDSPLAYAAELALTALTSEPSPPPVPSPSPPIVTPVAPMDRVVLTVRPTPPDARVRIMNIGPSYRDGITLAPDAEYDIEVSAPGYETYRRQHHLEAGHRELDVVLTERRGPAHGEVIRDRLKDGSEAPAMVFLRGGRFQMGSPAGEAGRDDDERPHAVTVGDVLIGRTEVTVGEFRRFVESSGYRTDDGGCAWRSPGFNQREDDPVVCVSWNDAQAYVAWLSSQTGEAYRLPTEAEWEYAARAGTTTSRFWGDDPDRACDYANVADETKGPEGHSWNDKHRCQDGHWYPAPVSSYRPNPWGLSDMLGNAWEWTCSAYDGAYGGAEGRCDASGEYRAVRGGAWDNKPAWVRAANRNWNSPADRYDIIGFRPARSP